jgi:predicted PurR-regulated permease PerM
MGLLLTIGIGVVSMLIAAIISSGWLAFVIGVVIAIALVAIVGRVRADGARPVRI